MSETETSQVDVFATPGSLLRAAREAQQLGEEEMAAHLNWLPGYVAIIERDDYRALRRPAFARGYVLAYGKLLDVDETLLLEALKQLKVTELERQQKMIRTRPLQLQRTGVGVIVGLTVLLLLVLGLWWWQGQAVHPEPVAGNGAPGVELEQRALQQITAAQ